MKHSCGAAPAHHAGLPTPVVGSHARGHGHAAAGRRRDRAAPDTTRAAGTSGPGSAPPRARGEGQGPGGGGGCGRGPPGWRAPARQVLYGWASEQGGPACGLGAAGGGRVGRLRQWAAGPDRQRLGPGGPASEWPVVEHPWAPWRQGAPAWTCRVTEGAGPAVASLETAWHTLPAGRGRREGHQRRRALSSTHACSRRATSRTPDAQR